MPEPSGPAADRESRRQLDRSERRVHGTAAAPGVAVGHVARFVPRRVGTPTGTGASLDESQAEPEIERLRGAIEQVRGRIKGARERVGSSTGEAEAAIFDAHLLMLDDPMLSGEIERRIREEQRPAAAAIAEVAAELHAEFEQLSDEQLRARAADVDDIAAQLCRALEGEPQAWTFPENTIVVAEDLLPSDLALFDPNRVVGLVTERGSRTAHVAILARALEMPAIVGASGALAAAEEGEGAIVDGDWGDLILSPAAETLPDYQERLNVERQERGRLEALHAVPALTLDDVRIAMHANIGSADEAESALTHGAEGIGLFRTEFLFLDRESPPDEDEQYAVYSRVAEVMGERPVVIRALDVGGDKPVPGIHLQPEPNPFLGMRGLRLLLSHPDLMRTQVRAILRAAVVGNLRLMFPMVATLQDVADARLVVEEAAAELAEQNVPYRADLPIGVMVETPAAALNAAALIRRVDFFSIGSNDLAQYTLAVDRTNDRLAQRYPALDPAVLWLIGETVSAADAEGKPVALCGELAGDPEAIPLLLGLGLRELSMPAPRIAPAKGIVRRLRLSDAEERVQRLLTAGVDQ